MATDESIIKLNAEQAYPFHEALRKVRESIDAGKERQELEAKLCKHAGNLVMNRGTLHWERSFGYAGVERRMSALAPIDTGNNDQLIILGDHVYRPGRGEMQKGTKLVGMTRTRYESLAHSPFDFPSNLLREGATLATFTNGSPTSRVEIPGVEHPDLALLHSIGIVLDYIDISTPILSPSEQPTPS